MNLKKLFLFFVLAIYCSFFSKVYAENLVLGVEKLNYLPFYSSTNNEYSGYARELFDQFAKDNQHTIEYRILPVARLLQQLIKGKIDLKFPDNPLWKQKEKKPYDIIYSQDIVEYTDGVMVKAKDLNKAETYFKKIGTLRGFTPWPLLDKVDNKTIQLSEQNSLSVLVQQTLLQRIQGSYINIDVAKYYLDNKLDKANALVFNPRLAYDKGNYYLSTSTKPQIIKQFNLWLENNRIFDRQLKIKWGL